MDKSNEDMENEEFVEQDDDGWGEEGEDDGWDSNPEEPNVEDISPLTKAQSSDLDFLKDYEFFKANEIISKRIPNAIRKLDQTLCLENDDKLIAIMRHFKWNFN